MDNCLGWFRSIEPCISVMKSDAPWGLFMVKLLYKISNRSLCTLLQFKPTLLPCSFWRPLNEHGEPGLKCSWASSDPASTQVQNLFFYWSQGTNLALWSKRDQNLGQYYFLMTQSMRFCWHDTSIPQGALSIKDSESIGISLRQTCGTWFQ